MVEMPIAYSLIRHRLALFNQRSKAQRYSVYCHKRLRKTQFGHFGLRNNLNDQSINNIVVKYFFLFINKSLNQIIVSASVEFYTYKIIDIRTKPFSQMFCMLQDFANIIFLE